MDTNEIYSRVMKMWAPPAYHVLTEVRDGTGYAVRGGFADVLAMSIWPSRGIELIGGEVKASRSDWLREKKDPAKAEAFFRHCHRWYLITGPDVAREEEIPATWGWMQAGPRGLKVMKAAPPLTPALPEWRFLASIFRKIGGKTQGMVSESEVNRIVEERAQKAVQERIARFDHSEKVSREEREKYHLLLDALRRFECASGVQINTWNPDPGHAAYQGQLFRLFQESGRKDLVSSLERLLQQLDAISGNLRTVVQGEKQNAEQFTKITPA